MTTYPILPHREVQRLAAHCVDNRNALVLSHMPMCIRVASRYSSDYSTVDDLIQEGVLGLYQACDRYDPDKGSFSTYAYWWVRKYVAQCATKSRCICEPLSTELLCDSDIEQAECRIDAEQLLARLNPRARYVVYQSALGRTYSDIARDMGLSKQGVAYIRNQAMATLVECTNGS